MPASLAQRPRSSEDCFREEILALRDGALQIGAREGTAQDADGVTRVDGEIPRVGLVRVAHDEPSRREATQLARELLGVVDPADARCESVDDASAIGIRLQPANAPKASVRERPVVAHERISSKIMPSTSL